MTRRGRAAPTLLRQIAVRLAVLMTAFVLVESAMVIGLYAADKDGLADDMIDLETARVLAAPPALAASVPPPLGVQDWRVRVAPAPPPGPDHEVAPLSWTRRDELPGGAVRIAGARSRTVRGEPRWARVEFVVRDPVSFAPAILKELLDHVGGPLVPLMAILFIFAITSVRQVLRPLQRAVGEVDALSPTHPGQRLTRPDAPREVEALVEGFNRALARIDAAMDRLHEFTAEVAHELRTPISVLTLAVSEVEPPALREELRQDLAGMTRLVNQLLDLARAGSLAIEPAEPVDLADVARETLQKLAPLALNQGRDLRFFDMDGDTRISGHGEAIGRALANLIDNALKHGGAQGPIDVTLGPGPVLSVRDHGEGVSPEDAKRLFEPFWRKNPDVAGAGLGLQIARTIAESHGGSASAANAPDGGAVFRLTFGPAIA